MLGLSLTIQENSAECRALIAGLCRASRNRAVVAIGGGSAIVRDPLLVEAAGQDARATSIA